MYGLNVANRGRLLQRPLLEDLGITHRGTACTQRKMQKVSQIGLTSDFPL